MKRGDPDALRALFGTAEPPERVQTLEAGPLTAELRGGNIGRVFFRGVEVLRGISYLARDESWGTCPSEIEKVSIRRASDGFEVRYKAKVHGPGGALACEAVITATPSSLEFSVTAVPDKDFKTNRTGFVVLHPISGVAGRPVIVTHGAGAVTRGRFPKLISPGQPFFDVSALEHRPAPGLGALVELRGGKFEMEDQRNWGDASFKTYVCSLLDPWPYILKAGQSFQQKVILRLTGDVRSASSAAAAPIFPLTWRKVRRPDIGIALSPEDVSASLEHLQQLKALKPDFLSCCWDKDTPGDAIAAYARAARGSGLPVTAEIVLPGRDMAEQETCVAAKALSAAGLAPDCIVVTQAQDLKSFQPTDARPWGHTYEEMAQAARQHFPGARIGGGMISYFTELNRKRPPQGLFDFITHSICPIVHDAGDTAVMQTLETLPHIFASARRIIGRTPYHIGPTTIAARLNPYGSSVAANPEHRRVCLAPNDPRQSGEFAVTWNLGLIASAARARVKRLTLGGLCGPRGLLDAEGRKTPLYKFLQALLGARHIEVAAKCEGGMEAVRPFEALEYPVFIGNGSSEPQSILLNGKRITAAPFRTRSVMAS